MTEREEARALGEKVEEEELGENEVLQQTVVDDLTDVDLRVYYNVARRLEP